MRSAPCGPDFKQVARSRADLRILGSNLLGEEGYLVASSGLLSPVSPRTVRAVLTVAFGAND